MRSLHVDLFNANFSHPIGFITSIAGLDDATIGPNMLSVHNVHAIATAVCAHRGQIRCELRLIFKTFPAYVDDELATMLAARTLTRLRLHSRDAPDTTVVSAVLAMLARDSHHCNHVTLLYCPASIVLTQQAVAAAVAAAVDLRALPYTEN